MFTFFQHAFGKVAIGISSLLISVAGFIAPAQKQEQPSHFNATTTLSAATTTDQSAQIQELRKEVEDIKKTSTDSAPAKVISNPKPTEEANKGFYCNGKYSSLVCTGGRKLQCPPTGDALCVSNSDVLCNGKYWAQCPAGQTFICPQTGDASCSAQTQVNSTVKNYYIDFKIRINTSISIYRAYETWLQDTSNQLRSAVLTLSSYPAMGGLYGESRDAAIKLANGEISVISTLITSVQQQVSKWQSIIDIMNNDPQGFIDEATFNKLSTPDSLEVDIEQTKTSMNQTVNLVMNSLQYH